MWSAKRWHPESKPKHSAVSKFKYAMTSFNIWYIFAHIYIYIWHILKNLFPYIFYSFIYNTVWWWLLLLLLFKNINSLGFSLSACFTAQAPFIEPQQKTQTEINNTNTQKENIKQTIYYKCNSSSKITK